MAAAIQVKEKVSFHRDIYRSVIKGLLHQRDSGEFCDVILGVNGRKFYAHKAVLAAASPYFRSMFTSRMREETSPEVDLSESLLVENHDSFRYVLDFIYCGDLEINTDNAEDLLRISDFLLLEDIKEYCRQFYIEHGNLNLSNCVCLAVLAEQHNLPEVALIARGIIKARFHDHIIYSDEFVDIPESIISRLLEDREIVQFASNDSLVHGILKWVKHMESERFSSLLPLLSCVHLQSLSRSTVRELLKKPEVRADPQMFDQLSAVEAASGDAATGKSSMTLPLKKSLWSPTRPIEHRGISPSGDQKLPVIVAANCNPGFRFLKIIMYCVTEQIWYNLPINIDSVLHAIPPRLCICNLTQNDRFVFLFLCYNLPYPSDTVRIQIMSIDIQTGDHKLYTFRHVNNQNLCCQTTLTDDRIVPPVIVYCHGYLVVVANREGTGNLFLCDPESQTYSCYPVPGVRFISLARAIVKNGRYIFLWCRHRFGHEEYCINKEVTFVRFDCKYKKFSLLGMPPPPGVSYGEFSDPHTMALDQDSVVIHTPGKSSLILDEIRNEWLTFHRRLPWFPQPKLPPELPYQGFEVFVASGADVFLLQNPAAYTTSMCCLQDLPTKGAFHPPPPVDCISLTCSGVVSPELLHTLEPCQIFDDTFTRLVHNRSASFDYDTEGSETPRSPNSDSDDEYEFDGFEYDEDIYGYYDDGEW